MKKILLLLLLVALGLFTWNCEKDDICDEATSTTPRIVLHFYDAANPTLEKNITNLRAAGDGSGADPIDVTGVAEVKLPLKTTGDATTYHLILNSTSTTLDNEDVLTFNYARNEIFVSRACGYKMIFQLDAATPFIQSEGETPDGAWMQGIQVTQPNVENENEVHISVYF